MLGKIRGVGWGGEEAAENGRNKELYSIARTITGERRRRKVGVKDKQGVLKTSFDSVHRESMWNIMGNSALDNERDSRHIRRILLRLNRAIQHNQERRRQKICVKDKQGVIKTESKERLQRWLSI